LSLLQDRPWAPLDIGVAPRVDMGIDEIAFLKGHRDFVAVISNEKWMFVVAVA